MPDTIGCARNGRSVSAGPIVRECIETRQAIGRTDRQTSLGLLMQFVYMLSNS